MSKQNQINVRLNDDDKSKLDSMVEHTGWSMNQVIRELIRHSTVEVRISQTKVGDYV